MWWGQLNFHTSWARGRNALNRQHTEGVKFDVFLVAVGYPVKELLQFIPQRLLQKGVDRIGPQ